MQTQKYVKVTITMDPTVLEDMKKYLKRANTSPELAHLSQSKFITYIVSAYLNNKSTDNE